MKPPMYRSTLEKLMDRYTERFGLGVPPVILRGYSQGTESIDLPGMLTTALKNNPPVKEWQDLPFDGEDVVGGYLPGLDDNRGGY